MQLKLSYVANICNGGEQILPWSALPLGTIGIIIGLSILVATSLAIILIKIKRYEELGWVLGVFFILLSSITFLYLIPHEIVDNAKIPEDYIWEDEGTVTYWERNSVFFQKGPQYKLPSFIEDILIRREPIEKTFVGKEVIHVTNFNKYENKAKIHDAIYDENGEIFSVLNNLEEVSEWYEIDTHLTSLEYVNVEAGRMGIPTDIGTKSVIRMGWVESNGEKDGGENVVLVREMKKIKTGTIDGLELAVWQSDISNTPITWHGEPYICDETLRLTVHPKTGYIVNIYRHLVLSAHLSQFFKIYNPDLLKSRFVNRFLKSTDPIGEGAELIYETTPESQASHIAEAKSFDAQLTYYPMLICVPMFIIGLLLVWRYCGRSYYWKRYQDFEKYPESTLETKSKIPSVKRYLVFRKFIKISAIFIGLILIISSLSIVLYGAVINEDSGWFIFNDNDEESDLIEAVPPTPPGTSRGLDSGRHVLEPKDEGPHKISRREWWYFNVFFNGPGSDLQDWSMIISFNKMARKDMRLVKRDNFFMILYDDEGTSYNFNILNQRRGTLNYDGPGVDLSFKDSWAKGAYPTWQVHGENLEKDFTVDLTYSADFLPVWVEGRSANLVFGKAMAGDYYIPRCNVEGTINWEGKEYTVYGVGYHDHVWETNIPRFISKGWDWANIHFTNGWEMYFSKFKIRGPFDIYAGSLIISPNDRNIVEWATFDLEYVEQRYSENMLSMYYPVKYHLEASSGDMELVLDFTLYNVEEITWRIARTGMFEGPIYASGNFSWDGNTVELEGYGMSEVTRVNYLFSNLNLFSRLKKKFSFNS